MSLLLYKLGIVLYRMAIGMAALFSEKAAQWVAGRKGWRGKLEAAMSSLPPGKRVWIHCASLGEFEQGRPVIEALKAQYPHCRIILTFFSPSGYEIRKDYELADFVGYLPLDGRRNAKAFIAAVRPSLVLFVKYEFWYYYLDTVFRHGIPTLLLSAAFRESQPFFQWYGGLFRQVLRRFDRIFVQDEASLRLLAGIGIEKQAMLGGDTRYDRVADIAAQARELPDVAAFKGEDRLLIAGSTWPQDESLLQSVWPGLPAGWKLVIAPHEIDRPHVRQVAALFGGEALLFSALSAGETAAGKRVLIIDNIGMLSSLYRYGEIAFIGGGFNKGGIHNILEPAVFGLPVLFGPVYEKFVEAAALVALQYAFPVADAMATRTVLLPLMEDEEQRQGMQQGLIGYMQAQRGATEKVLSLIDGHRWLADQT